jgi:ribosomal protein S18 acetylase RimI-like enzyme
MSAPTMFQPPFRLGPRDAERYARLRLCMLADAPWAFAASPEDDFAIDLARLTDLLREEQNAIVAIEADGSSELVAAAGIMRMKRTKSSHRARLWGVFVAPQCRGRGMGRAVAGAAIDLARSWPGVDFVDLGVSERAVEAHQLYASLGFEAWGREPETTQVAGRRYDEIYMSRRLRA